MIFTGDRARSSRWRSRVGAIPAATWALTVLVTAGAFVRVIAAVSWWPTVTTIADSWPYAAYAEGNPFGDPQHPAGYPVMLRLIGAVSREAALPVLLQHLGGIAAALFLYAAVRRITGSPWPGMLPAGVVLLNADQVFLEHTILSEGPFVTVLAASIYATVRAFDAPVPWWRWPALAGGLAVIATTIRSAGLFFIPVAVVALLLAQPRARRARLAAPVAMAGVSAVLLVGFAATNRVANGRFELGPTQGWHLYGRVGPFADCSQFTPPKGTEVLCETTPKADRFGNDWYLYDPNSPANRYFGSRPWEQHDKELQSFAVAVILHQPGDYIRAMWKDLSRYFVPSSQAVRRGDGGDLHPQLDWTGSDDGADLIVRDVEAGLQVFFRPFRTETAAGGLQFLHDYQRIFNFGAFRLTMATLATLLGLCIGTRRARAGVVLCGLGGLALFVAPTLSVYYVGRYSVPSAGPLAAGAAIGIWSLWCLERDRRRGLSGAGPDDESPAEPRAVLHAVGKIAPTTLQSPQPSQAVPRPAGAAPPPAQDRAAPTPERSPTTRGEA